jgi:hypothetical protein
MGKIEIDHTGAGAGITLSSDGTALLLDGTAVGGGGTALELYAENPSSPTAPSATGSNAVAIGNGAVASGTYAQSFGRTATATAVYATAIGTNTDANSNYSTAMGLNSGSGGSQAVTGLGAMALGGSYASGADSFAAAIANNTSSYGATGANSVAIGQLAKATNISATAVGTNAISAGVRSVALSYSYAGGTDSFAAAIGSTSATLGSLGAQSVAIGKSALASATKSASLGPEAIVGSSGTNAVAVGTAYSNGSGSFAAAIANNTASYGATGTNSIAMGDRAKATGSRAFATGYASIASGNGAKAFGGFGSGTGTLASKEGSTAIGDGAKSEVSYKLAISTRSFAAQGDAQTGITTLRVQTTSTTPIALYSDTNSPDTGNQVILPNNSAYAFHGTIVARQQASQGTACAAWKVEGLIRREGSAGTTVLVNSATTILDNTPAWGMTLSADATNGGLKIEVTGAAATNIRFVATINTSEVTY